MSQMLLDDSTYKPLRKDPTTGIQTKCNTMLQNLRDLNMLSTYEYYNLSCRNGTISKIYGVVKTTVYGPRLFPAIPINPGL